MATFFLVKWPATTGAMEPADFERRRNTWVFIVLAAFLSHNAWIFFSVALVAVFVSSLRESNKPALFAFLLLAVPAIAKDIPGIGGINYFFTLNYVRLLALAILLPTSLVLRAQPQSAPFGRLLADKLLIFYLALNCILMFTASTFTNTLRYGVFYAFADVVLPYYVFSRGLRSPGLFRDFFMAFVTAALVTSAIAVFEFGKHWLLFSALQDVLGVQWIFGGYLEREDALRTVATTGHPIILGYVIAAAIGLMLPLRRHMKNQAHWWLIFGLLTAGVVTPLSRGPWLGAALIVLVFVATAVGAKARLVTFGILVAAIGGALIASGVGQRIIDFLPFVGDVDTQTITYRQRLLQISVQVILEHPFFGAYDFMYAPAMQELRQGQGIIDIVNSYIGVALSSGLVGLVLYCGFFIVIAYRLYDGLRAAKKSSPELYELGQGLLAALLGILLIIFTASSVSLVPTIYWTVAGAVVGFSQLLERYAASKDKKHAAYKLSADFLHTFVPASAAQYKGD